MIGKIADDIAIGLENAYPPLGFMTDPARCDGRNAGRAEHDSGVRQIRGRIDHRHTHGVHRGRRQTDEPLDQVDIVNHEVENDVDLSAPLLPGRNAVAFNVERPGDIAGKGAIGAGEALDMADLQHPPAPLCESGEGPGAFEIVGERLFNQHVNAGVDQLPSHLEMLRRGHCDTRPRDTADQGAGITGRFGAEFVRHCPGPRLVDIDDGDQFGSRIGCILLCVEASEVPRPNDGDRNGLCHIFRHLNHRLWRS